MTLSTCKHCGSPAGIVKGVTDPHYCWSVACCNVDACGIRTGDFSRQQDAIDAWNRQAYAHRNGEAEAPTVEGLYWFRGIIENYLNNGTMRRPIEVINTSGEVLAWNDAVRSFREIEEFAGQWWGPIMPPWEKTNE